MKTILGIIASPRKLGNSEILVKAISEALDTEHQLRLIRLSDFDIQPCNACYKCLFDSQRCVIDDDLPIIIDEMASADAVILAAPTYFLSANSRIKTVLDRGLAFYSIADKLRKKPAVSVAVAGIKNKDGFTKLACESFLKSLQFDIKASEVFYAAYPGELMNQHGISDDIKKIAHALFSDIERTVEQNCPLCGGDSFRFLEGNNVQCLLCSNIGLWHTDNSGSIRFDIQRDEHGLFLSRQDSIKHQQWLRSMKTEFLNHLKSLNDIRKKYRNIGIIISPPRKK